MLYWIFDLDYTLYDLPMEIGFNYNGTVSGSFTSISEDTLITGITINQVVNDTALLIMASIIFFFV